MSAEQDEKYSKIVRKLIEHENTLQNYNFSSIAIRSVKRWPRFACALIALLSWLGWRPTQFWSPLNSEET